MVFIPRVYVPINSDCVGSIPFSVFAITAVLTIVVIILLIWFIFK